MVDTVRSRPNHYEMLGLTPAASSDEIAQAFAKELSLLPLRPFGSFAQVSIAYETLRDPIKRVAYDASLFPQPEPGHSLIGRLEGAPFLGGVSAEPAKAVTDSSPPLAPHLTPRQEPLAEPRTAPSVTASLRQPPNPTTKETQPIPAMKPDELRRPNTAEKPRLEPQAGGNRSLHRDVAERVVHGEASIDWKLPALAAGALTLAVALGAWTGWEAGNDNEQVQPDRTAMLKIPPAKIPPTIDASPAAEAPSMAVPRPERRKRAPIATTPIERTRPPLQIELPEEGPAEAAQTDQGQLEEIATEQVLTEPPAVAARAAKLPLPNAVIARTIGRIGYACGEVASTTAIEGEAPGVFKVTCTSGHSYRAAPVRGRYHFRRLGSR